MEESDHDLNTSKNALLAYLRQNSISKNLQMRSMYAPSFFLQSSMVLILFYTASFARLVDIMLTLVCIFLFCRAFANFKAKVNRSHKFKSSDPRLKFLSKSLRDEIRVAVYKPMLRNIHIFKDAEERHLLPHKDPQIAYTTQLLRSIPALHFTGVKT